MTPQFDFQVYSLLSYLYVALRSDDVLMKWLGSGPDHIVRGRYQMQPIVEAEGAINVAATQLPCIAAYVTESTVDMSRVPGGMIENVELWYVMDTPVDDTINGVPVSGLERAQIWQRAVWDRICYWLRRTRLEIIGLAFDLMDDGRIDTLEPVRATYFPPGASYGGFRAQVNMTRVQPPFAVADPTILQQIEYHLATGDTLGTAGVPPSPADGVYIEGEVTGLDT